MLEYYYFYFAYYLFVYCVFGEQNANVRGRISAHDRYVCPTPNNNNNNMNILYALHIQLRAPHYTWRLT